MIVINENVYTEELYKHTCHIMDRMKRCNIVLLKRLLVDIKFKKDGRKIYTIANIDTFVDDLLTLKQFSFSEDYDDVIFEYPEWQKDLGDKIFSDQELADVVIEALDKDNNLQVDLKVLIMVKFGFPDIASSYFISKLIDVHGEYKYDKLFRNDYFLRYMGYLIREVFAHRDIRSNDEFIRSLVFQIHDKQHRLEEVLFDNLLNKVFDSASNMTLFQLGVDLPKFTELQEAIKEDLIGRAILNGNKSTINEIKSTQKELFDTYKLPWFDDLNELTSVPIEDLNKWTNAHMNQNNKKLFVPGHRGLFIAFVLVKNNDDRSIKALLTLANDGIKHYKSSISSEKDKYQGAYAFLRLYARVFNGKEISGEAAWENIYNDIENIQTPSAIIGIWVAKWLGYDGAAMDVFSYHQDDLSDYDDNEYINRLWIEFMEITENAGIGGNWSIQLDSKMRDEFYSYQFLQKAEEWTKALKLIQTLTEEETKHANACIMWVVRSSHYYMDILPYERSYGKTGLSKGRKLSITKLKNSPPTSATALDIHVANQFDENHDDYDMSSLGRMLLALSKHPHVYTDNDYKKRVEIIEYPFIVEITQKKDVYHISANQHIQENYFFREISKSKFHVTKASDIEIKFSRILKECNDKIVVPQDQWSAFQQTLKGLSTKLFIDSNTTDATVTIQESIAAPIIQMRPIRDLLKVDFVVKHHDSQTHYSQLGANTKNMVIEGENRSFLVRPDKKKENKIIKEITKVFSDVDFEFDNEEMSVISNSTLESLELLSFIRENFKSWTILWPEGESFKLSKPITEKDLNIQVSSSNGWFQVSSNWHPDSENVMSLVELMQRTNNGHNRFIQLDEDNYIAMSESLQKKLQQISSFGEMPLQDDQSIRIHPMLMEIFDDWFQEDQVEIPTQWKKRRDQIQKVDKKKFTTSKEYKAELRDYQDEGFQWMCKLYELGLGACLADDMGLGKTIQILAVLDKYKTKGPSVVVAPSSVTINWEKEIERFAPTLNCKVLPLKGRDKFVKALTKGDILLVSYGVLQSNTKLLENNSWNVVALDEAHAIKNNQTSRSKSVMNLDAKFRIAATGTPVQNHLGELWNLFQFLIPGLLGDYKSFQLKYITGEHASKNKELLKQLFKPFLLRRTKEEVLTELPEKTEIVREIEFSKEEKEYYEASRIVAQKNIENADDGKARFQILSEITKLRQACLSSALVDDKMTLESSKLKAFEELIYTILDGDHKVLVFSQFTGYLRMIEEKVKQLGYEYCYLDGSTSKAKRAAQMKTFQEGTPKIFLISLKAGGLGLNLTAADYVIHMDPWWNPAIEDQATDRAHRMGQEKPVTVYRLITKGTIEEKIIALHETKRNLADQILEGTDTSSTLDLDELKSLVL
ncbi:DEAD/DEAH box helicase [Halosquirtibacter xylanolyticus]|uniref:DEAD/DEAH box helicase n=1 Tax=Halosquirtibacter xylanolyticus TaxID=3374599 RepID=UPI0037495166|nr:DEAD/DEAH box helicase [Prolixibacteraceae bacterium]